ncbi:cysteine desulfurase family protein [Prochlorococcus marinus]|uniref:cysteine desulfurase family protein n=1 Tax=Prochlorococcus marinus TaxID=1219 RepID=UPI0022B49712|nr:cysteine desulfurase family protein [Prochlorococcus marinus]
MKTSPLAFDYQSTTPCSPRVVEAMNPFWNEFWGNPSNRQNSLGLNASASISIAREQLASFFKISPERLIFTSGATEANNLALLGHARAQLYEKGRPGHVITLSTEHHSVLEPLRQLKKEGFRVTELIPDLNGIISLETLIDAFEDDTFLVSIMAANNEIGVLQPIEEIASLCKIRGVIFHSDYTQCFGNLPIEIDKLGVDLLSISGHKIYGPKGIGLLIMCNNCPLQPLQWGGDQEHGLRAGTVPVPLVIGLAKAAEIAIEEMDMNVQNLRFLRDQLWKGLNLQIPDLVINGSLDKRLPNNLNFTVLGVQGSRLHKKLRLVLTCSSGSACSNGYPSHVLMSLGRTIKEAEASLRLSLGRETTLNEVELAVEAISKVVKDLRT